MGTVFPFVMFFVAVVGIIVAVIIILTLILKVNSWPLDGISGRVKFFKMVQYLQVVKARKPKL